MNAGSDAIELWGGWQVVEVVDDAVDLDGLTIHRAGITAVSPNGLSAFGSAASLDDSPLCRARAELVERAAIAEAMASPADAFETRDGSGRPLGAAPKSSVFPQSNAANWQYARSNGVASGASWKEACRRAREELAERDALLRAWYAGRAPVHTDIPVTMLPATSSYDWHAGVLPTSTWAPELITVAIFAFPRTGELPLLRGFAAATEHRIALGRALGECLQSLAFLAEEPLPTGAPDPTASPLYHMDSYLFPGGHPRLRDWLFGQVSMELALDVAPRRDVSTVAFADLTPAGAPTSWKVARALCDDALPLTFGDGPPWVPRPLRAHPIA